MPHKYGKNSGMSKKSYESATKKEMKKPIMKMDMKKMKK